MRRVVRFFDDPEREHRIAVGRLFLRGDLFEAPVVEDDLFRRERGIPFLFVDHLRAQRKSGQKQQR